MTYRAAARALFDSFGRSDHAASMGWSDTEEYLELLDDCRTNITAEDTDFDADDSCPPEVLSAAREHMETR